MARIRAVLFDIDGTLLDSNDAHAHAWLDALRGHGIDVPLDHVRARMGMSSDRLLRELADIDAHSVEGRAIKERRSAILRGHYMPDLGPLPGSRALVDRLRSRGLVCAAVSTATRSEVGDLLRAAAVADLIDVVVSDDDADVTKEESDLVEVALERIGVPAGEAIVIGDSPHDIEAAARAGVAAIAFRSGGFRDADLAGAVAIYNNPSDLASHLDDSPLARGLAEEGHPPFSPRVRRTALRGGA